MKTCIISIINQKGGTGKTTTSVNLSSALAALGHKVLTIDLDPQGNLSYSLGFEEFENSIYNALTEETSFDKIVLKSENFDLIPADIKLADFELDLVNTYNRYFKLKTVFEKNNISNYDFVIIDCPPSISLLTLNALTASNYILIPMQFEVLSLQGLKMILKTYQNVVEKLNPDLQIAGILPVMYDKRRNVTKEIKEHIEQNFQVPIFKNFIRTDVKIIEAPSFGKSVIAYAPNSPSANDYLAFAKELTEE